jgi:MoaA/NifB/PqqE/SkfB family radical SAM enzyme
MLTTKERLHKPSCLTLEMSLRCNQECVHCFNHSGPDQYSPDDLTKEDFFRLLREGAEVGFPFLQLAGGEPMIFRGLSEVIREADKLKYGTEVFSNLSVLPDNVLQSLVDCKGRIGFSFYSKNPAIHQKIVAREGGKNWYSTVGNIKRLLAAGVPTRAGIIVMDENKEDAPGAVEFLHSIGVEDVRIAPVQGVGRAETTYREPQPMDNLCGACCYGTLTIDPKGNVFPCSMGREFPVGNIKQTSLVEIARSEGLAKVRGDIYAHFTAKFGPDYRRRMRLAHEVKGECGIADHLGIDDLDPCGPGKYDYAKTGGSRLKKNPAPCCCAPEDRSCSPYGRGCSPEGDVRPPNDINVQESCCCAPSTWCLPQRIPCSPKNDVRPPDEIKATVGTGQVDLCRKL